MDFGRYNRSLNPMYEMDSHSVSNRSADMNNFVRVATDIETTSLAPSAEIFEIAACSNDTDFDVYMNPSISISPEAARITGFQTKGGKLYHGNEEMRTIPAKDAVLEYLGYLKSFGRPVILIAHNAFRFDAPRIIKLIEFHGLIQEFTDTVQGFVDSLTVFKELLPQRVAERKSFSLPALVADYLAEVNIGSLHRASTDVWVLYDLMTKFRVSDDMLLKHYKSTHQIVFEEQRSRN